MQVLGQRVRLPVAAPFLFVFQAASAMREDSLYGRRAVDLEKVLDGSRILFSILVFVLFADTSHGPVRTTPSSGSTMLPWSINT